VPFVEVPTGVADYPGEVLRWPRSWVERQYNVTHWATMPRGGHFAAMEQPVLFADDLRRFFATVREEDIEERP
jgi:epoxide hydrolase